MKQVFELLLPLIAVAAAGQQANALVQCGDPGTGVKQEDSTFLRQVVGITFQICDGTFGGQQFNQSVAEALQPAIVANDAPLLKMICNPVKEGTNVCAQYFGVLLSLQGFKDCDPAVRAADPNYKMAMEIKKCKQQDLEDPQAAAEIDEAADTFGLQSLEAAGEFPWQRKCGDWPFTGVKRADATFLKQVVGITFEICDATFGGAQFNQSVAEALKGNDTALLKMICDNDPHPPAATALAMASSSPSWELLAPAEFGRPLTNVCAQYFGVLLSLQGFKDCYPSVRAADPNYKMALEISRCKKPQQQQEQPQGTEVIHI